MQLSIRDLRFSRGRFSLHIDDLNLESGKHFIMGPNGSGKTTLMKIVSGILPPDSGEILLDRVPAGTRRVWERRVAYIPQDLLLFPNMSVERNLTFPVTHGRGRIDIFHKMVREMDLQDLLQRRTDQISGGQAQRVAVARAIISAPSLLLMDEPLSMQDQSSRIWILSRLDDLMRDYSFSVIYVTHDQSDLDFGFDSVTFMHRGRMVEKATSLDSLKSAVSRSMLHYGNVVQIGDRHYYVEEKAIRFSNSGGYTFRSWNAPGYTVMLVTIDGRDYFLRTGKRPEGRFLEFVENLLKPLETGS